MSFWNNCVSVRVRLSVWASLCVYEHSCLSLSAPSIPLVYIYCMHIPINFLMYIYRQCVLWLIDMAACTCVWHEFTQLSSHPFLFLNFSMHPRSLVSLHPQLPPFPLQPPFWISASCGVLICQWVMWHVRINSVTHLNEACHNYKWVMTHIRIWMCYVTHMKYTYEWVMPHIQTSHVLFMNKSSHTYGWVICHVWMSHVTHMDKSCRTYNLNESRDAYECVFWLSHVAHMNVSCVSHVWISASTRTNESCATYEGVVAHMWDMANIWMSRVTQKWFMSHTWMSHVTRMNKSCHTHEWVMSHIWISHVMCISCHTYE